MNTAPGPGSKGIVVLIAEDDSRIRTLIHRVLVSHGHTVLTASDGVQALKLIRHTAVDLLVTDLDMPGLTGDELLLRVSCERPNLRTLVITGRLVVGDLPTNPPILAKPFSPDALRSAVAARLALA